MKSQQKANFFIKLCESELGVSVTSEYAFHTSRKWRFDYAILDHKIALEVEGGLYTGGRHTSINGYKKDIEKYNTATLLGWRLLRVLPEDLHKFKTLELIKEAINYPNHNNL